MAMCKAMVELIEEYRAQEYAKEYAEGFAIGVFEAYAQAVDDGDITLDRALEKLRMSLDEFYKKKAEFDSK